MDAQRERRGPGFGAAYADSQYVWLPLQFPSDTTLSLQGYDQITVDIVTGQVAGVAGSYVSLAGRESGKCADVVNASSASRAELVLYTCNGASNQQFRTNDVGGGYVQLVARHSGKCLDVPDHSTANSTRIRQWTCNGGTNQQWQRR